MSETQEETVQLEEDEKLTENREKLAKISKILLGATVIIIWGVSAGLGLRDIWTGKGILETPWVIFCIVFTFVLVIIVIMPLFKGLRADIQDYKKQKKQKNKN
ncbi:MAG: hypothetical protein H7645_04285 [Candidatus Heimdallarchaeota archaeon]|nr:hypothetical protein [Candidatus Heimdallarchaeota archaeon]MCK4769536.1 hypothetical protein [Candidatus Heimdallarchaeota archaeon]